MGIVLNDSSILRRSFSPRARRPFTARAAAAVASCLSIVPGPLGVAHAAERDARNGYSLLPDASAMRLGVGAPFGMFGTQVGLLWEVDESIHVGPLVGFGFLPGKEEGPHEPLWALGLHGRWGQSNRLVVELDYEAVAFRDYTLHGVGIRQEGLYGVGLRVGYEHLWQSGLHLLLAVGPGWEPETLGFTRLGSVSLGVGYQWGGTE